MLVINVNTIQKQHVDVEINRSPKTLDYGDGTGVCRGLCAAGFMGQVGGDGAVDDSQYFTHNGWFAGE